MSSRPSRKPPLPALPDTGAGGLSSDDEIEILEVTGVNETERPLEPVPTIDLETPPQPVESPDHAALVQALEKAERERDQNHDLRARALADLDNMKKRFEREAAERRLTDAAALFRRLLPVLDNLERALGTTPDSDNPLRNGVALIHQQLLEAMGREGLQLIEAVGTPFDPSRHEAVEMVAAPGCQPGIVLEEMQRGYLLKDRLVRPALVRVAAGAPAGDVSGGAAGPRAA